MLWFIIFSVAAIAGLLYYWFHVQYQYFEKRGVPGPKPTFPNGNIGSQITQKRNVTYDYDDIYQAYRGKAPFVGYFEMKTPSYLLIDPEMIKSVMVKNFKNFHDSAFSQITDKERDPLFGRNPFMLQGEEWKEKRAEITPAFTPNRLKALFPLVDEVLHRFSNYIHEEREKDTKAFDAREISAKFTTDVVSSCIFNADAQSFTKDKPEIREMGRRIFQFSPWVTVAFVLTTVFPVLKKLIKVKIVNKEVEDFFTNLMFQAIKHREQHQIKREDYLAYLIAMRNKKQLSEIDMAAHGVTFFIDGFETSSGAIMNALFELGDNKKVQEKLRNEIKDIFDDNGKLIYDKLVDHEYLDQVFHEALRLHPPATFTNRLCTEPIELEGVKGKKHKFTVGETLMIPIYSIHRDPDNYTDPDKFIPERFDADKGGIKAYKDKGVFLSFGDGPRICLGMRFALMQSKAAVAHLVRNFEISIDEKTKRPLVIDPKEFLNVKDGGIWLNFKPIKI